MTIPLWKRPTICRVGVRPPSAESLGGHPGRSAVSDFLLAGLSDTGVAEILLARLSSSTGYSLVDNERGAKG